MNLVLFLYNLRLCLPQICESLYYNNLGGRHFPTAQSGQKSPKNKQKNECKENDLP